MLKETITLPVRFSDCDPMGHTNNAVYFTFMEQARVAMFKRLFGVKPSDPVTAQTFPFIIAEIRCRFLKPTFPDDLLTIEAFVTEIKNSSFIIGYNLTNTFGEQVATGDSVLVWYDYQLGRPQRIPDLWREKLNL